MTVPGSDPRGRYEVYIDVRHHERHNDEDERREAAAFKLVDTGEPAQMVADCLRQFADELAPAVGPSGERAEPETLRHIYEGESVPDGEIIMCIVGREDVPTGSGANYRTRYIVATAHPTGRAAGAVSAHKPDDEREWDRRYDAAMQSRDWMTCDQLLDERDQAGWYRGEPDDETTLTEPEGESQPEGQGQALGEHHPLPSGSVSGGSPGLEAAALIHHTLNLVLAHDRSLPLWEEVTKALAALAALVARADELEAERNGLREMVRVLGGEL